MFDAGMEGNSFCLAQTCYVRKHHLTCLPGQNVPIATFQKILKCEMSVGVVFLVDFLYGFQNCTADTRLAIDLCVQGFISFSTNRPLIIFITIDFLLLIFVSNMALYAAAPRAIDGITIELMVYRPTVV